MAAVQAKQRRNKNSKAAGSSSDGQERKTKARVEKTKDRRDKIILWTLVIVGLIILVTFITAGLFRNQNTSEQHSTDPVSKILRDIVDQCETLLTLEVQV